MLDWTRHQFAAIDELHAKAEAFNVRVLNSQDEAETEAAILDLAERLGAEFLVPLEVCGVTLDGGYSAESYRED